jgi:hypothetical protein
VRAALSDSRYGFCLVLNEHRVVLGLVRRSAIEDAELAAPAEGAMEPGPGTVGFNAPAVELLQRLAAKDLRTAVVTTLAGASSASSTAPTPNDISTNGGRHDRWCAKRAGSWAASRDTSSSAVTRSSGTGRGDPGGIQRAQRRVVAGTGGCS